MFEKSTKARIGGVMAGAFMLSAGLLMSASASATVMTMTFDTVGSGSYTSYSEDGINIAADNVGNHFHGTGTAARFYQSDGFPQTVDIGGPLFSLISIDFLSFNSTIDAVITSSLGAIEVINTTGTFLFGTGFNGITSFSIASQQGGSDLNFVLDNIVVTDVPEPGTLALFGLGLAGLGVARRKRMV